MPKNIIIANWKSNPRTQKDAEVLFERISAGAKKIKSDIVVCPPSVFLPALITKSKLKKAKNIFIGAQNSAADDGGPHTGEVSAAMLKSIGAQYVIIGHSERREMGESDELINKKVLQALKYGLNVILAIGETNQTDDAHMIIQKELHADLAGVSSSQMKKVSIAYEPRWAISRGQGDMATKSDTPENAIEKSIVIRRVISKLYSATIATGLKVLYGGSVRSKNIASFVHKDSGFNGALVGGASLDAKEFLELLSRVRS